MHHRGDMGQGIGGGTGVCGRGFRFALLYCLAAAVCPGAVPSWPYPEYPRRIVASVPEEVGQSLLVNIPAPEVPFELSAVMARDADDQPMASKVVYAGADVISALVRVRGDDRGRRIVVYYGAATGSSPRTSLPLDRDPWPVLLEIQRMAGRAVPTSWEKMRFMLSSVHGQTERSYYASFNAVDPGVVTDAKEALAAVRTYVLCPKDGVYRFAVDCDDAGFLLLDGEPAAQWPGEHEAGAWKEGAPVLVRAGAHLLEFYNRGLGRASPIRVGWRPPGTEEIRLIPDDLFLTAAVAENMRLERIDRTLHPGFTFRERRTYMFKDASPLFTPVDFRSTSENWLPGPVKCSWDFGDGAVDQGERVAHVYARPGKYTVTLAARDSLGFEQTWTDRVECRAEDPIPYVLNAELAGLPPVCYQIDQVDPCVKLWGTNLPPGGADVQIEIHRRAGGRKSLAFHFDPAAGVSSFPVPAHKAGALSRLEWRASHRGAVIASGAVEFVAPSFKRPPAVVEGDRIYARDGAQLVLVPRYYAEARVAVMPANPVPRRIACVDDSLAAFGFSGGEKQRFDEILGWHLADRGPCRVLYVRMPEWSEADRTYGPLLKLVQAPALVDREADAVVLSLGLRDILNGVPPETYERQIAALTDLLLSSNRRVIWTTPPPYPPEPARIRPFAAAVRRVAEGRGIPVADLYTAFLCTEDPRRPLFQGDCLAPTSLGQLLAGKIIANAVLFEKEEEPCRSTRWSLVSDNLR